MKPGFITLVSNWRYHDGVKRPFGIAAGLAVSGILALAQTPPPAGAILADAETRAQAGQRAIFLIFHASW